MTTESNRARMVREELLNSAFERYDLPAEARGRSRVLAFTDDRGMLVRSFKPRRPVALTRPLAYSPNGVADR